MMNVCNCGDVWDSPRHNIVHCVSKNCANLFLSALCQIREMAKRLKLCISPNSRHHITVLNADVPNCYRTHNILCVII